MHKKNFIFTSESVTEGHPDKVADKISDAILDALIEQDPQSRVAVETLVKTGFVVVAGEVTTNAYADVPKIIRKAVCDIGYNRSELGFDGNSCGILSAIEEQSADIALGVNASTNRDREQGAGDQGMMFGYACDDTPELMPAPISFAHALTSRLAAARKDNELTWLRPDGKSQVTVEYADGHAKRIDTVVISTQHDPDITHKEIEDAVRECIIYKALPKHMLDDKTKIFINPTGNFVIGGPKGDSGVTGRKIIVDTYGGMGRHGGGAFSGKDPSKVDRSAAYMARYIAKNVVAAGLADKCEVQLAYAIGVADPVSVMAETFGTAKVDEDKIAKAIRSVFGLKPAQIISQLHLLRPIYQKTTNYGHFGRKIPECLWEYTDKAEALRDFCGLKA